MTTSFVHTVDGDYTTAQFLGRTPKSSGIRELNHFLYAENWIQHRDNYYPLPLGTLHPEGLEDPYVFNQESGAGNMFDLVSGGVGQPLYLVAEEVVQYTGPLVIFRRIYCSLPQTWEGKEFGHYTFPGYRAKKVRLVTDPLTGDSVFQYYLVTSSHPRSVPCLINVKHEYRLGYPTTFVGLSTIYRALIGGSWGGSNSTDYLGYAYDESGEIVAVNGSASKTPVVSISFNQWQGPVIEIITRQVVYSLD